MKITFHPRPLAVAQIACLGLGMGTLGLAQTQHTPPSPLAAASAPVPAGNLYAVEIKTGPAWDASKPAQEQAHFREHSVNLRRLRESGVLVMGARYADKGLVVLRAATEAEAHAMMQADPSIEARVFAYELHEFRVFYSGSVATPARRP